MGFFFLVFLFFIFSVERHSQMLAGPFRQEKGKPLGDGFFVKSGAVLLCAESR